MNFRNISDSNKYLKEKSSIKCYSIVWIASLTLQGPLLVDQDFSLAYQVSPLVDLLVACLAGYWT